MAKRKAGASANTLQDEDIDDSLLDSPVKPTRPSKEAVATTQSSKPKHEDQQARDQALRQELAAVRKVNETIEGVIESLDKAKTNMKVRDIPLTRHIR